VVAAAAIKPKLDASGAGGAKKAPHSSSINRYKGFRVSAAFVGSGQHSGKLADNFGLTTQL
jgi:hypothetical protein